MGQNNDLVRNTSLFTQMFIQRKKKCEEIRDFYICDILLQFLMFLNHFHRMVWVGKDL